MSDVTFQIPLPSDNDGYCLMQCPTCGEYFKLKPSDVQDDGVLEVHCPACGLVGESYITEDVKELAIAIGTNYAKNILNEEIKKIEKQFKSGIISIKTVRKFEPEPENPIRSGIEALTVVQFPCCKQSAKIKPLLQITGCYCPFCGVKDYDTE
jgi:uncharacterized C2H2 Zn-finger protein